MTILNRILEQIDEKFSSQKEFEKYMNLRRGIITDWKTGRSESYLKMLNEIAKALDVSVSYLMEGGKAIENDNIEATTSIIKQLLISHNINTLTEEMLEQFEKVIISYKSDSKK